MVKIREFIKNVYQVGRAFVIPLPKEYVEKHNIKKGDSFRIYINGYIHMRPIKEELKAVERKMKRAQKELEKIRADGS